ncbi:glycerophosphodiester phosphodiesterase GDPDL4 [Selaginella moellendorffii]|uniref:glycerophosphodiester phosphodiesterase GDPDL4 n=1 Tax=Selaginella moellendorffii TaxID=88036 RepID=UPI000D1CB1CE|nr:glycerophosphodiester phosphodiesterase GDPDL4 [Selaginella moellendorffii]|eukprot:XP_024534529.1 glycerophosphodiester phosphodiesterase GDPDL4 [Selaginella moellendorffii]
MCWYRRSLRALLLAAVVISVARAQRGPAPAPSATPVGSSWKTLTGAKPLVISNGQSGVFSDQTLRSYADALKKTSGGIALYCDLQLSKDGQPICRTQIGLEATTNIGDIFPGANSTYIVNGEPINGYFAVDFTSIQLSNVTARQGPLSRPATFDGDPLASPDMVAGLLASYTNTTGLPGLLWLNVEYCKFYDDRKINMTSYVLSTLRNLSPDYISTPELGLLRTLRSRASSRSRTKIVLKVNDLTDPEPTTNQTYAALLANLTNIRTLTSGILVSKSLIRTFNPTTLLLENPTTIVQDAHRARLEVHAFGFANDQYPNSYNYSFDPIREILYFIDDPSFAVDGVSSDFPTTASLAIDCYGNQNGGKSPEASDKVIAPFKSKRVITHNGGDSGNYPGSTRLAYSSAIGKGADYIDCIVQMTKDGVAICTQSPDLLLNTDVSATPLLSRTKTYESLQDAPGIFTFDFTWDEIKSLKAKIYNPESAIVRNKANDGTQSLLTLSDFLNITKDSPNVGVYLVLQRAYLLNGTFGIDTVAAVSAALRQAGFTNTSNVVIQSEDATVLRALRNLVSAELIYSVPGNKTLTDAVLEEIKQFASGVAVPRSLVSPTADSFLTVPTDVVERVHNHSLSVVVVYFRNPFTTIPFDFLADPTLELNTYVQFYDIDGIVTDFPETAKSYLTNRCVSRGSSSSSPIPLILPGDLGLAPPPAGAPFPALDVAEPPLPSLAQPPAPAPSSTRSSSTGTLPGLQLVTACLVASFLGRHLL